MHKSPGGEVLPPKSSLWNEVGFDYVKFTVYYLIFYKDFLADYKVLSTKSSPKLSDMKENHLLRGLML